MDWNTVAMSALAVIGVVLAALAFRRDVVRDRAQGVFRVAKLDVALFGERERTTFHLVTRLDEARFVDFPLAFALVNGGDRTSHDVQLIVRTPKVLRFDGKMKVLPSEGAIGFRASMAGETEHLQTVVFEVDQL